MLNVPSDDGMEFVKRKLSTSFKGYLENGSRDGDSYELEILGGNGGKQSLGHFRPDPDLPDGESMDEFIKGYAARVIGFTLGPEIFSEVGMGYQLVLKKR